MEKRRQKIDALIAAAGGATDDHDLVVEIIETALRFAKGMPDRGDLKILHTTLKEMRYAFQLFKPYRKVRKVSVFGSARTVLPQEIYDQASAFGQKIVAAGFMVITGAGDGIMRAVQRGAGRRDSFGINILLPFEQEANEFIENDPKLATFKYFFTRKLFFVKEADAIVLFPGGFGTHDEGFEALTLLQTGKSPPLPLVMIDAPDGHYWTRWQAYIQDELLKNNLISEEDMHLFRVVHRVEDAVSEITQFYRNYHSLRFVGDRLILRLNRPLSAERLAALNDQFTDVIEREQIVAIDALPEEANEPDLRALPRLALYFNKRNFGRLRQMIDAINLDA